MPNPLKILHSIIWSKSDIPTRLAYETLCHLALDSGARAYLKDGNYYDVAVSNAGGTPGWHRRGQVFGLLHGCHRDGRPWLELDKEASRSCKEGVRAYKITEAGYEAMVQYQARNRYETDHLELAQRLLKEERAKIDALKPK